MCVLSYIQLFAPLWTAAFQAPPSTEFSRQDYLSGLPFPTPGDLPIPGFKAEPLASPVLANGATWEAQWRTYINSLFLSFLMNELVKIVATWHDLRRVRWVPPVKVLSLAWAQQTLTELMLLLHSITPHIITELILSPVDMDHTRGEKWPHTEVLGKQLFLQDFLACRDQCEWLKIIYQ